MSSNDPCSPTVTVIISHINSVHTIDRCIQHLLNQDYPSELVDIIVVDGGSKDGSIGVVRKIENERVHQILTPGCTEAEGHNIGIKASKSEIIMLTNSDIYVPSDWIKKHVRWLENGYDIVGGRVFWGGDKFAFAWNMPIQKSPKFIQQEGLGLGFSNCSFRRDLIFSVGELKDLRSQHDTEFAFRVVRSGGKMILDPDIEVYHDHPFKSYKLSFMRSFGYTFNHVIVMKTSYGRLVLGSGSPAMIQVSTLVKELLLINGIKVYRQLHCEAFKRNIRVSLTEFLFIRMLSRELGQLLGAFLAGIRHKVSLETISDLHGQTETKTTKKEIEPQEIVVTRS